jgi:hypothetical protein
MNTKQILDEEEIEAIFFDAFVRALVSIERENIMEFARMIEKAVQLKQGEMYES